LGSAGSRSSSVPHPRRAGLIPAAAQRFRLGGRLVMQRPAKPRTSVRFRPWPQSAVPPASTNVSKEVAATAQPGNAQLDRPGPRLPVALAAEPKFPARQKLSGKPRRHYHASFPRPLGKSLSRARMRLGGAPWTLIASLLIMAGFVFLGIRMPGELAVVANDLLVFTTRHFGWLYLFLTTGFLLFCLGVGMSAYGHIRLGADGEAPEFPYPTWLGMIFSSGMGVGLVFWGVAEPMSHYLAPPLGRADAQTPEAARLAMQYSLFHWGFHLW